MEQCRVTATPYLALATAVSRAARLIGRLEADDREVYAERLRRAMRQSAAESGFPPAATELLIGLSLEVALMTADPDPEPEHQPTEQPRTTH